MFKFAVEWLTGRTASETDSLNVRAFVCVAQSPEDNAASGYIRPAICRPKNLTPSLCDH